MKKSPQSANRRNNRRLQHHNVLDASDALLAGYGQSTHRLAPYSPFTHEETATVELKKTNQRRLTERIREKNLVRKEQEDGQDHEMASRSPTEKETVIRHPDQLIRSWPMLELESPLAVESLHQTPSGSRRAIDIYMPHFHADNAHESNGLAAAITNVAQLTPRRLPKVREPEPTDKDLQPAKTIRRLVFGADQRQIEEHMRRMNLNFNRCATYKPLEPPPEYRRPGGF